MSEINKQVVPTGRRLKEDDSAINIADKISPTPLENSSEMLTVTSASAISLTGPSGALGARLQPSHPIRFWLDGTAPTPTEGYYIGAFDTFELESPAEIAGLKMIAVSQESSVAVGYTRLSA